MKKEFLKEFIFKTQLLTEEEINLIADCFVHKLLKQVPSLATNPDRTVEEPIKMREVCRLLQISDTTARSWMAKGTLSFHRIGSRVFFYKSQVLSSLEQPLTSRKEGKKWKA
ncbi:hypothetical protein AHMF7605_11280 [Adhaeribacter arboris]|uniref:Helix-turn-helix domain-containing protein n=1 Tax=Adhaeribacter arboris TaxID=2072846 RepID=A0A2T2YEX6_9BACT|nr:helix-turn-helix domain-containing protein [Adhaeribacter arboris]PSR54060.1 hypothetical protein AHMF7605_11280 [Adhaeribacter arboris]